MPDRKLALSERLRYFGLALLTVCNTYVCAALASQALASLSDDLLLLSTVPLLCSTVMVTALTGAFLPGPTCARIGLWRGAGRGVPAGLALGFAACAALVPAAVLSGLAEWAPVDAGALRFDFRSAPALGLALLAIGATGEELFARGLVLQCLARALGPAGAVILTSAGFAVLHGANPGITLLATLNTALFGAAFGALVLRQRCLWSAIGLHLGWNVAQALLGVNTSGITIRLTALNLRLGEPEWITGGKYGFEGGLLATGAVLVLLAIAWQLPVAAAPLLWEANHERGGILASGPGRLDCAGGREPGGPRGERED